MANTGLRFNYHLFNKKKLLEILTQYGDYKTIKIAYFSTHSLNYTRTEYLLNLFDEIGLNVDVVRSNYKNFFRYLDALYQLFVNKNKYDLVIVAFRGHEVLPFVRLIIPKKPIIFDAFVSVYDTLGFDRRIIKPKSVLGWLLKLYDIFLCKISNLVLVDTNTHAKYFKSEFGCKNIDYLYVGCNTKMFYLRKKRIKKKGDTFVVFWYGEGNPLQGVDIILKAAKQLENQSDIVFRIGGPIKEKYHSMIDNLSLKNVEFLGRIPYESLPDEIEKADLCLAGHFSDLPKARRVIPGKAFQFYEMGKKMILKHTDDSKKLFGEMDNSIFLKKDIKKSLVELILCISNSK